MKTIFAVAAALALSGCGLPPALTVISYALDGLSLLSTGKSVGDHALSAAISKDCAVWRVVKDENVCREFESGENGRTVLAANELERGAEIAGLTDAEPEMARGTGPLPVMLGVVDPVVLPQFAGDGAAPADGAGLGIRVPSGPIADPFGAIERAPGPDLLARATADAPWVLPVGLAPVAAIERAWLTSRDPPLEASGAAAADNARVAGRVAARVLVLGSFTRLDNARRIVRLRSGFRPVIVRARLGGTIFHRVIIAAPGGDVDRRRRQLASLGQSFWAAELCGAENAGPSAGERCVAMPAVVRR